MAYSSHGLHKMQISHISIYFGHICTNFISLSHSRLLAMTDARSCSLSINYAPYKYPGGDSAYERGGDAHRKFWIEPLKESDLGGVQAFFDP